MRWQQRPIVASVLASMAAWFLATVPALGQTAQDALKDVPEKAAGFAEPAGHLVEQAFAEPRDGTELRRILVPKKLLVLLEAVAMVRDESLIGGSMFQQ